MKKLAYILFVICFSATVIQAKDSVPTGAIQISDFEITQEPGSIMMEFNIHIGKRAVKSRSTLTLLPVLRKGNDTLEFRPVVIRGKRARILFDRRFIASPGSMSGFEQGQDDAIIAGNETTVDYMAAFTYEDWMAGAALTLDAVHENCCTAVRTNLGTISGNFILPKDEFYEDEKIVIPGRLLSTGDKLSGLFPFVESYGDMGNDSEGSDYANDIRMNPCKNTVSIYFPVNKFNLDQDYRDNRQTLIDILSVVREITDSGDSEVEKVVIGGFASPDGGYELNLKLSDNRAKEVRRFILDNSKIDPARVEVYAGGQNWAGLKCALESSDPPYKEEVLDILNKTYGHDAQSNRNRENELKRLRNGEPYAYMVKNLFPNLRSAAYIKIFYSNKQ